eukprot:Gregarina_sp_Poly_1__969@NODE_1235_length_4691_cov_205_040441_g841_i0_p3_GENE_NODE_1235_length_4691_cov_205_040441_g841_i0NODE_1235_length_4691_cov_205_040441_g841_i0_p3_ORF_typecomplete_len240_score26_34_NODE_1235_length_4691_cov_205_040441_g841_i011031822
MSASKKGKTAWRSESKEETEAEGCERGAPASDPSFSSSYSPKQGVKRPLEFVNWGEGGAAGGIPHTPPQLFTETTLASTGDAYLKRDCTTTSRSDVAAADPFLCYPECHVWMEGSFPTPSYVGTEDENHWALIQRLRNTLNSQQGCYGYGSGGPGAQHSAVMANSGAAPISIFDMVEIIVTCPSFSTFCLNEMTKRASQSKETQDFGLIAESESTPGLLCITCIGCSASLFNMMRYNNF